MAAIGSASNSANVLDNLNIDKRNIGANEKVASDKDMFMRLMLAQM